MRRRPSATRHPSPVPSSLVLHALRSAMGAALATTATLAAAQGSGLVQRETEGPAALRTPTEAAMGRDSAPATPLRLTDFFLFSHVDGVVTTAGGLRFSSGLYGPQRPFSLFDAQIDNGPSQPYLGVGYTRAWFRSGVSVNADLGLTSPASSGGARLRGLLTGSQNFDDTMRELRWSPVMSVNVKYAF